jgi:hypothetical protein
MMTKISYGGYRFPPEIIQQAIWLYIRFTLSFRDVEDLLAAGRYPAHAVGETFHGEVNHVIEAKLARPSGFRRAAGRRNHLAGALRPRELIGCVADRPADPWSQHRHARLKSGLRQRDLRRQIGHWKAGRNDIVDRVGHERQIFRPRRQPFLPRAVLTNAVGSTRARPPGLPERIGGPERSGAASRTSSGLRPAKPMAIASGMNRLP